MRKCKIKRLPRFEEGVWWAAGGNVKFRIDGGDVLLRTVEDDDESALLGTELLIPELPHAAREVLSATTKVYEAYAQQVCVSQQRAQKRHSIVTMLTTSAEHYTKRWNKLQEDEKQANNDSEVHEILEQISALRARLEERSHYEDVLREQAKTDKLAEHKRKVAFVKAREKLTRVLRQCLRRGQQSVYDGCTQNPGSPICAPSDRGDADSSPLLHTDSASRLARFSSVQSAASSRTSLSEQHAGSRQAPPTLAESSQIRSSRNNSLPSFGEGVPSPLLQADDFPSENATPLTTHVMQETGPPHLGTSGSMSASTGKRKPPMVPVEPPQKGEDPNYLRHHQLQQPQCQPNQARQRPAQSQQRQRQQVPDPRPYRRILQDDSAAIQQQDAPSTLIGQNKQPQRPSGVPPSQTQMHSADRRADIEQLSQSPITAGMWPQSHRSEEMRSERKPSALAFDAPHQRAVQPPEQATAFTRVRRRPASKTGKQRARSPTFSPRNVTVTPTMLDGWRAISAIRGKTLFSRAPEDDDDVGELTLLADSAPGSARNTSPTCKQWQRRMSGTCRTTTAGTVRILTCSTSQDFRDLSQKTPVFPSSPQRSARPGKLLFGRATQLPSPFSELRYAQDIRITTSNKLRQADVESPFRGVFEKAPVFDLRSLFLSST
ncbi:hypothetical protein DIPPA_70079 [Diplonema papillatum]|nr:hypothetical protein DIPPA_70079 [Diplonema papillatum]